MNGIKGVLGIMMVCMVMCFAGCGEEKLVSEDCSRTNFGNNVINPIMRTEAGYYYNQSGYEPLSLRYYDAENCKNMYLCNKPECRHDGNEFCAATSDKYKVIDTVLYSGSIYISAVEETQSSYDFKLLKASVDGSSLSEVVTFFSIDNATLMPGNTRRIVKNMVIHRNKAFLPYALTNGKNEEVGISGTAIYDMETGEVTYLGEKDGDLNSQDGQFCGYGDYMYFAAAQKYKTELYRYSYDDGSVEKVELKTGFKGNYAVYDENTIFYIRGQGEVWVFHVDTKENLQIDIEKWWGFWEDVETEDGMKSVMSMGYYVSDVISDGEYVYIPEGIGFDYHSRILEKESYATKKVIDYVEVTILDGQGNFVNDVKVSPKYLLGYNEYFSLHFIDDTVYMQTSVMVYECSKADFIAGNANFKECYPLDINIRSAKELE